MHEPNFFKIVLRGRGGGLALYLKEIFKPVKYGFEFGILFTGHSLT